MLWKVFEAITPKIVDIYRRISAPPVPNLRGDRDIEYSWVASNIPEGCGNALDFGSGTSYMGLLAARKGFNVVAIDLARQESAYTHPELHFIQGDIFELDLEKSSFDLIINCSAIEHVGLAGRYGVTKTRVDGDIEVMTELSKVLGKPNCTQILTIPVGRDRVFAPWHRVYGKERLPRLLNRWKQIKSEFWIKNSSNAWIMVDEKEALNREPLEHCYGLGLFVLCNQGERN